jgi:hypothetical protein
VVVPIRKFSTYDNSSDLEAMGKSLLANIQPNAKKSEDTVIGKREFALTAPTAIRVSRLPIASPQYILQEQ